MYNTITPNKIGGCQKLINYLDKEEQMAVEYIVKDESLTHEFAKYLDKENQMLKYNKDLFFDGEGRDYDVDDVISSIDNNRKGLKKKETNFYSLTFNPSSKEIRHLENIASEELKKMEYAGLSVDEFYKEKDKLVRELLKEYTISTMDIYAKNFGREGINSNRDLVWKGKVERDRFYKSTDKNVIHNKKINREIKAAQLKNDTDKVTELKQQFILESQLREGGKDVPVFAMMPKSGTNYHVHVIVSRRDKEQKMSLSPLAKARSNDKHMINGKECKIGFDRNTFREGMENSFDENFEYRRYFEESFIGKNCLKNDPENYEKLREEYYNSKDWYKDMLKERERKRGQYIMKRIAARNAEKLESKAKTLSYNLVQRAGLEYIQESIAPYKKIYKYAKMGTKLYKAAQLKKEQEKAIKTTYQSYLKYGGGKMGKDVMRQTEKQVAKSLAKAGISKAVPVVGQVLSAVTMLGGGGTSGNDRDR